MPGGVNGQFGGWGQNPNWGGTMPDPGTYRAPSQRGMNWSDPSTRYDENYDERSYWTDEIQRIRMEIQRITNSQRNSAGASPQAREMLRALQSQLREARLNLARAPGKQGSGEAGSGSGGGGGFDFSQSMGQEQGEGGARNISDMWKLFDQFQKRMASGRAKFGGGEIPAAWSPDDAAVPRSSIDPMAVIRSAKPRLEEEMNRMMGGAAQRLGMAGVPLSSGSYTKELGKAARKSAADLGELTMNTLFQAGENQAQREAAAQEAARDRSLSAWGQRGDWEFQSGRDLEANWNQWMPQFMQLMGTVAPSTRWRW